MSFEKGQFRICRACTYRYCFVEILGRAVKENFFIPHPDFKEYLVWKVQIHKMVILNIKQNIPIPQKVGDECAVNQDKLDRELETKELLEL